eukprot:TRINITY_DN1713_c0_g2_i1.p1 TRINITY_DN1713_c0_g2~~TRINITY_DN1713_c0_g2_i1.p1  ORF type:complete len:1124 (-),score=191.47 TRINITY_DN1713_c0_g2_i1:16-3198(-)
MDSEHESEIDSVESLLEDTIYVWKLQNFSQITEKEYSDVFELDKHKWRLLLWCHPNEDNIGLFLEIMDRHTFSMGWFLKARFTLTLLNQTYGTHFRKFVHSREFKEGESVDFGFKEFIPLHKIVDPSEGFLVDDVLKIEVCVKVEKSHIHLLPLTRHMEWNYDSKKETGYVGLKNQGATCYMNSVLQALYHLGSFRKAVYLMPTEADRSKNTIPLALQRVFFQLQFEDKSVGTKELTKSFGWTAHDSFTQHDVQELNRVLCDNLENQMKATVVEGTIEKLFQGKQTSYIKCRNIEYESSKTESYYDLSLNVKGCNDVYESLDQYTEVEILQGSNQYFAEGHGLQDAEKGVKFESFPPVLQIQLKRFEYDQLRGDNVKINERYVFPPVLDLVKYLRDPKDGCTIYHLHGILVHSGNVYGGHYYAFIRPTKANEWFKYDDDKVIRVEPHQAIEENYGGTEMYFNGRRYQNIYQKYTSAYMLYYIRESDQDAILAPVEVTEIPEHLTLRFQEEKEQREAAKRAKAEELKYTRIKVVTEEDLKRHDQSKFDLIDFDTVETLRVLKTCTYLDVHKEIEEQYGIPHFKQRFWRFDTRMNKTVRADKLILSSKSVDPRTKRAQEQRVFLEVSRVAEPAVPSARKIQYFRLNRADDVLLFFKYYDPVNSSLRYVGHWVALNGQLCEVLETVARTFVELPTDQEILLYEEIRPTMIERINPRATLKKSEITGGDIIVFQPLIPEDEEKDYRFPTAPKFYEHLLKKVSVDFRKLEEPRESVVKIDLQKDTPFPRLVELLSQHLNHDPDKIRLTAINTSTNAPRHKAIVVSDYEKEGHPLLGAMLPSGHSFDPSQTNVLFYELLELPLSELENKRTIKISWVNWSTTVSKTVSILVPKDEVVGYLMAELERHLEVPRERMRIVESGNCRIHHIYRDNNPLSQIAENASIFAEEVPEEECDLQPGDQVLHAYHFSRSNQYHTYFGQPFHFVVKKGDTVGDIRQRLLERLKVSETEFKKWKIHFMPKYIPGGLGDEVLAREVLTPHSDLGLEHKDPNSSRSRIYYEKPVKFNI